MLILIIPSQTEAEDQDIWIGNSDTKLSDHGRKVALDFGRYDQWVKPNRFYSAPQTHIAEFAALIYPSKTPVLIEEFTDRSMGNLTGRTYRETMHEFPRRNWLAWQRSYWSAPPEGESLFDISDRVLTAFRTKILPIPSTENVLMVVSADVVRVLLGFLTKVEEPEIPKLQLEPAIPYVVNGDIA